MRFLISVVIEITAESHFRALRKQICKLLETLAEVDRGGNEIFLSEKHFRRLQGLRRVFTTLGSNRIGRYNLKGTTK